MSALFDICLGFRICEVSGLLLLLQFVLILHVVILKLVPIFGSIGGQVHFSVLVVNFCRIFEIALKLFKGYILFFVDFVVIHQIS